MTLSRLLMAIFATLAFGLSLATASEIQTQAVQFAEGRSTAVIHGRIKGFQAIDYTLKARTGQTLQVKLRTRHGANYFNVLPPGSNDAAIFIGQTEGPEWSGILPEDGEYKLRVYLMRSAARRNEIANFTLTVSLSNDSKQNLGEAPASDAKVAGTWRKTRYRTQMV